MDAERGKETPGDFRQTHILNDDGIDPGVVEQTQFGHGVGQFVGENEDVQRHVGFDPMVVEKGHDFGQIVFGKILRPHARIEARQSEIDRIRAIGHGGAQAVPIAGRSKKLRDCGTRSAECGMVRSRSHFRSLFRNPLWGNGDPASPLRGNGDPASPLAHSATPRFRIPGRVPRPRGARGCARVPRRSASNRSAYWAGNVRGCAIRAPARPAARRAS